MTQLKLKNVITGEIEWEWKEPPLIPNAHLQFFFSKYGVLANYVNDDMSGTVAPTDSRFRYDVRLLEENKVDEAEKAKCEIEEEQRRKRKLAAEGKII